MMTLGRRDLEWRVSGIVVEPWSCGAVETWSCVTVKLWPQSRVVIICLASFKSSRAPDEACARTTLDDSPNCWDVNTSHDETVY